MISLIIPTYNRPQFIGRLLRYYRELNFPYTIFVADASPAPACEANQNTVASLRDVLSIRYELYRPDINPVLKIAQALATVDSKYVVLCGDDDFIVPKAIEQCARFLEANPDYSIAHGRASAFSFRSKADHDSHHGLQTVTYGQCTIEFDDPKPRVQNHLMAYEATFYSVHRRLDLIRNMQLAYEHTLDYRFGELLASCLSLIQGKARCLDILYLVRQSVPDSAGRQVPSWQAFLTADDYSQRYAQFRNCLAEELAGVSGMSMAEAQEVVNEAYWGLLANHVFCHGSLSAQGSQSILEQTVRRAVRVIQILPAAARSAFLDRQLVAMIRSPRAAYRKLRREREQPGQRNDMSLDRLLDPRSPFHADFLPVYEQVMRYPYGVTPSP